MNYGNIALLRPGIVATWEVCQQEGQVSTVERQESQNHVIAIACFLFERPLGDISAM